MPPVQSRGNWSSDDGAQRLWRWRRHRARAGCESSWPWPAVLGLIVMLVACVGCEGHRDQSMLSPAGPAAERVATLWWVMFAVYGVVFVLTLVLLAAALLAPRRPKPRLGSGFVVVAGIVIPTLVLVAMLIYTARLTQVDDEVEPAMTVVVTGHRWWWDVRYPEYGIVDANEIHIPVGVPVELELQSADVIHSFWAPNLAGKMDLLPEHVTTLRLQADRPGVYRGQCAEYCGTQHALMAFRVVVHEPQQMQQWLEERREQIELAAADDADDVGQVGESRRSRGEAVYLASGCGACHRIQGVSAGEAGPDLTHIGSRRTIAAGVYENTPTNLDRWINNPQLMKPGSFMPATQLTSEDRKALIDYLRSLK